jgi:response regulator RpfG family c-di-GMP phosphodiesterase
VVLIYRRFFKFVVTNNQTMKLFVIDWSRDDKTPLLDYCKSSGHKVVGSELRDGGEAYKKSAGCKADAIVINYSLLASHGRITAQEIKRRKATSQIPIYFIGGSEDDNEKVQNIGICLSEEELKDLLLND